MAASDTRIVIKLKSPESPFTYVTTKNKRNDPDRMVLRKYDPVVMRQVEFKEGK